MVPAIIDDIRIIHILWYRSISIYRYFRYVLIVLDLVNI